jgi:hypothetical protein
VAEATFGSRGRAVRQEQPGDGGVIERCPGVHKAPSNVGPLLGKERRGGRIAHEVEVGARKVSAEGQQCGVRQQRVADGAGPQDEEARDGRRIGRSLAHRPLPDTSFPLS